MRDGCSIRDASKPGGLRNMMSTRSRTLIALAAGAVFGFSASVTSGVLAEPPSAIVNTAAAAGAATVANATTHAAGGTDSAALPWEEARLFAEVYERIKREYV